MREAPLLPGSYSNGKKKTSNNIVPLAGYIPAFTSIDSITPSQIQQIPPYSEAGTKYEGFSKTLKGSGYKINKQEPIKFNKFLSSESSISLYNPMQGKAFYMTDLIIQRSVAGTNVVYLTDGALASASGVFLTLFLHASPHSIVLHFDVPLKFTTDAVITIVIGGADGIYFNGVGWIEDE